MPCNSRNSPATRYWGPAPKIAKIGMRGCGTCCALDFPADSTRRHGPLHLLRDRSQCRRCDDNQSRDYPASHLGGDGAHSSKVEKAPPLRAVARINGRLFLRILDREQNRIFGLGNRLRELVDAVFEGRGQIVCTMNSRRRTSLRSVATRWAGPSCGGSAATAATC